MGDAVIRSYYQILVLLYLPLTGMCMSYFGCRKAEDGSWVLDVAPSRPCFNSSYYAVFPFAVVFFLLYCLSIPGFIFWLLYTRNKSAHEDDDDGMGLILFQLKYGFLVARFKESNYFFETFIMLRKFSVVLMTTFFYTAETKSNAAVLALGASFIQLCLTLPYRAKFHNIMAILCLGSCAAVLEGGTVEDEGFRGFIVITAILVNTGVIFGGNALDIWRLRKEEEEAEDQFYQPGTMKVAGDGSVVKDGEEMASAMGTMTNDASYHVVDGNATEWTLHGVGDDDISPSMDSFANSANSSTAFSSANFVSQTR